METAPALHFPLFSSPPIPANLHRRCQNVRRQPNFTMPLRDLNLRRITVNQSHFRFNHTREAFCSITNNLTSINHHTMAEKSKDKDVEQEKTLSVGESREEKDKESEKSTLHIPPPPEKPLPGDCCDSGCVRCVWDMYYEELEEYNRLYKAES